MASEKILSRVKDSVTGEEYTIGVRGNKEQIALKLTAKTEVQWELFNISIQDLSDNTEQVKQLSTDGECNFEIPLGNRYSITLPFVEGYTQPHRIYYTAAISSRNVEYNYSNLNEHLTIRISVLSSLESNNASIFNGLEVICRSISGVDYSGNIQNGQVTILIPYGVEYSIVMPKFDGLSSNHNDTERYLAGLPARNLTFTYIDYLNMHVFGIDADNNMYTVNDLLNMGVEEASRIIVAGYLISNVLANASRKDGGIGCQFCWMIGNEIVNDKWASNIADFTKNNEVLASAINNGILSEACEPHSQYNLSEVEAVVDGSGECALIRQVGSVLANADLLSKSSPTPIFDNAYNYRLSLGGVERRGFIATLTQYMAYKNALIEVETFYSAIGKTPPNLFSGRFWIPILHSKSSANAILNGNFSNARSISESESGFLIFDY
jgi:hypothetical protein